MRDKQRYVLKEISDAFSNGYRHILLEAPTGFGKSAVAVAVAKTLGTSYICTSTKDLQAQYHNDFPFIAMIKGKCNFPCLVKEDFVNHGTYECNTCDNITGSKRRKFSSSFRGAPANTCNHTSVEYGLCLTDSAFKRECLQVPNTC